MAKQIVAKYAGVCGACGERFGTGAAILWESGKKAAHVSCPAKGPGALPVASAPARKSPPAVDVSGAPFVVYEKWAPMRRAALDSALASSFGETRRYSLRPVTRTVRAKPARLREVWAACPVCGAAPNTCCAGGDPKAPGLGRCVVEQAEPAREVPVSLADQRRDLPGLRASFPEPRDAKDVTDEERAAIVAHEAALAAVEPGVYVVVGAGKWRFQNAEDNEDMGDMQGANWSGPLYLRRATAEEAEADAKKRLADALPGVFKAMAGFFSRAAKRWAEEEMAVAAARPDYCRVALQFHPGFRARAEGKVDLWRGSDQDYSYRTRCVVDGAAVYESHDYVYDWDRPIWYVGPRTLLEPLQVAEAVVSWGWALQRSSRWAGLSKAA